MKKNTVIILGSFKGQRAVHFTEQPLAGSNNNIWFPIGNQDLLRAVENILQLNDQGEKITLVEQIRVHNEDCFDYRVTYNV